jgi:hypothetical protein
MENESICQAEVKFRNGKGRENTNFMQGGDMKSKIQVVTVFALMIAALSTPSGSVVAKDGPGPVCPPSTGCMV